MGDDEFDIWTVVLPAVGIAFAAFCVWLTVRIVNRRERWSKWTAVGLAMGLMFGYPLSIGPMERLYRGGAIPDWAVEPLRQCYRPVIFLGELIPQIAAWYMGLWIR